MERHPLTQLEFTRRTAKRAQYEAFEYTLVPEGVLVRNASHETPADHEYTVTIENGVPTHCECPADEYYEGACKHRVSIAIRRPLIQAVTDQQLIADGGIPAESQEPEQAHESENDEPTECVCADLSSLPCWECVRTGRKSLEETE
ncbi:SWIM zinc finger family protein [Saliphagus sp. GCM10025308]